MNDAVKQEGLVTLEELRTQMSAIVSRLQLAQKAGLQFDGDRDLYTVYGYKTDLKSDDFLSKYIRQDIASRIVDAPPNATWFGKPTIKGDATNTKAFHKLCRETKLWQAMHRADKLSRMNQFSLILFGFDDANPDKKLNPIKANELMYARPLSSRQVEEIKFETNPRNKRFGQPLMYKIKFDDPEVKSGDGEGANLKGIKDMDVHYTRVVHIVENPLEDDIYGTPIIEKCYNLLDDLLKISGGTAETFWLTGNRGMQADIDKEMEIDPADAAALADEIEEWHHNLRRFIRTRGVTLKDLGGNPPNPKEVFEMIIALLSGTAGIPRRILIGSEAGQLASEQDRANWAERIEERRVLSIDPFVLDPTLTLLQEVGLMPTIGNVEWAWPSAFIQNPLEQGQTAAQIARAVGNLSRQTGATTPMQVLSQEECRSVFADLMGIEGPLPEEYEPPEYQQDDPPNGDDDGSQDDGETEAEKAARAEKKDDQRRSDM